MKDIIKSYQFRDGLPIELEIIDISDLYTKHKNKLTIPHRAEFYEIIWVQKGNATHFIDFKSIKLKENSIVFVPKNSINFFDSSDKYNGLVILFTDNFFCKNKSDRNFLQSTILYNDLYDIIPINVKEKQADLNTMLSALVSEFNKQKDAAHYDILRNLLHNFLLLSERKIKDLGIKEINKSVSLENYLLFKDLLEKMFKSEKSVKNYASTLSLSVKQLNKATSQIGGKTPKKIINERIILEAKRLLVHSHLSIKEICYELGFEEPTYFNKFFRKYTKGTPAIFKQKYI